MFDFVLSMASRWGHYFLSPAMIERISGMARRTDVADDVSEGFEQRVSARLSEIRDVEPQSAASGGFGRKGR